MTKIEEIIALEREIDDNLTHIDFMTNRIIAFRKRIKKLYKVNFEIQKRDHNKLKN